MVAPGNSSSVEATVGACENNLWENHELKLKVLQ